MEQNRILRRGASVLLTLSLLLGCAACGGPSSPVSTEVPNGDFEEPHDPGKWVGWTREDAAFNVRGLVDSEKVNGAVMEKSGTYFFSGSDGGNPAMRGTLTSDVFQLGGTGVITFRMGAGKNTDKVYVEFFEEGKDDAPLAHIANEECDGVYITEHLIPKIVDLSDYVGKNIYIKVTDDDDGTELAYVNLDAFHVCQTQEEIDAAEADYALQMETYGPRPFEEDETSTTIVNGGFESGDLTGWQILDGTALTPANVVPTSQMYWTDRSVYGEGSYYLDGSNNGAIAETLTGAIRSTKFTLAGDGFISFMIGAAPRDAYVAVCDGETGEELITVGNDYFNDPALALTLLRVYVDASEYLGRVLYLKVVDANDGSNGGFAFMNVDDFQVSLTREEVAALEAKQMEQVQNETYNSASYDDLTSLRNYYHNYPYPVPLNALSITAYAENQVVDCGVVDVTALIQGAAAAYGDTALPDLTVSKVTFEETEITEGFEAVDMTQPGYYTVTYGASYEDAAVEATMTVVAVADHNQIPNGGFEAGNLAGWTVLTEGWAMADGQPTGVISAENYWDEALPYNQAGSYHLDGWNNGLAEADGWAVQSAPFTLAGSGYISLRMGGHATAVRVCLADGTEVGYYRQTRFADQNFPSLAAGGSWADMGTYVIDLSAYLGQELYLVLCDEAVDGGWAHAFFDEVVTYYETAPDYTTLSDQVADGGTGDVVEIPWQLAENQL